ncbi:putative primosomal protein n'(replication factor Y) [Halobacteriovorax marinus SJ]|uniref:Replication restart protein PriA n=1 Tax=Halobacteriovorax marinus (strain ATCC BAA-682 / DSM 15412 / SJ) TaxID=862908 RepID=E1X662_HALMS|nr:primosomal protein N' [Halobacteriovorax marinus]CBW27407.1 putative primosomal protein n'(replication factor Y) [Halobacteriovorax marinus SJ]
MKTYCKVAVKYPGPEGILTYECPTDFEVKRGDLVEVPLGRRKAAGCVVATGLGQDSVKEELEKYKLKPVSSKENELFSLSENELKLYEWMSRYYHYNLGMTIIECMPKILKRPRAVEFVEGLGEELPHELNPEQSLSFESIYSNVSGGFERFYIHGVTGSGKTSIYLKLMKKVLESGKSVLFLLPEINLTPQFTQTFAKYLSCKVFPYHSGVGDSEKNAIWKELKENKSPVLVMGVRSSVFLPIEDLGLVIVDEEHDQSFKQSDRCPYNGRDVAIKKAQLANAPVVLGSATPTVENYHSYSSKSENYFSLKKRAAGGFPEVELIDCREEKRLNRGSFKENELWPIHSKSLLAIKDKLAKGEQVLVFVNRLGFANYLQCRSCGFKFEDPNTNTPLRYFKGKNILKSAHSDYEIPTPDVCPECGNMSLLQQGFGTEKIQEVLQKHLEGYNIERFDRDEIKNVKQLEDKLTRFHNKEIDVFVGTQMLSKGHNFEKVNLVLVLGVDSIMNFPDFRAIEKAYQLITQINGRAGRYSPDAKVLIQTLTPGNKVFDYIKDHSFSEFYEDELMIREISKFPPFAKMAAIYFNSRFRSKLADNVVSVAATLKDVIAKNHLEVDILGPSPAMIEKRLNQYTWYIALKSHDINHLHKVLSFFERSYNRSNSISYKIDVDPYQIY